METRDVTIIGAGIVGASIAYKLSHYEELNIRVIDATDSATQASAASMAWLNASNKRPHDYFDLNFAGMKEYQVLRDELVADWYHATGTLASESFTPNLRGRMEELNAWGYQVEETTVASAYAEFAPGCQFTDPDELLGHYPAEGWIDTLGATRELLDVACRRNVVFQQGTPVTRIDQEDGRYFITLGDGTCVTTDIVVNAAGAKADRVATMLGRRLPLAPTKGLTIRVATPGFDLQKILLAPNVEIRPDGPGTIRAHSDDIDGMMAQGAATDREEIITALVERVRALLPTGQEQTLVKVFMANRPIPQDSFSCIGPVAGLDNYYEAVTHSGVTMGPLVGRLIEQFVVSGTHDKLLTPRFSPDRFTDDY